MTRAMAASGGVESVGPSNEEPDPVVQVLVAAVVQTEPDGAEHVLEAGADLAGELDERRKLCSLGTSAPPVEQRLDDEAVELVGVDGPETLLPTTGPQRPAVGKSTTGCWRGRMFGDGVGRHSPSTSS